MTLGLATSALACEWRGPDSAIDSALAAIRGGASSRSWLAARCGRVRRAAPRTSCRRSPTRARRACRRRARRRSRQSWTAGDGAAALAAGTSRGVGRSRRPPHRNQDATYRVKVEHDEAVAGGAGARSAAARRARQGTAPRREAEQGSVNRRPVGDEQSVRHLGRSLIAWPEICTERSPVQRLAFPARGDDLREPSRLAASGRRRVAA